MRQDSVDLESLEQQQACQSADALLCRGPPQLTRLTSSDRDDDTPPADIDDDDEEEEGERPGSTTVPDTDEGFFVQSKLETTRWTFGQTFAVISRAWSPQLNMIPYERRV